MIAIIDYGVGNLRSVEKAFQSLGYQVVVSGDPKKILESDKVVLPGVGAFGKSMENLERAGMVPVVKQVIQSGRPFLGICLGLQMLFEESAEVFGDEECSFRGLGIFPGQVLRFPPSELKVPQIGWNQIHKNKNIPLLHGIEDGSFVYFVHSYYVKPAVDDLVTCTTNYGFDYCSGIVSQNVAAFQFHPEKSSRVGLQILKNFGELEF
ncbi:MAG TPA: imidazole glycerol phosphate synthase subunit HisH [Firmicutes bacterium]|jgi:imidazole glycerol-phosphate synthase subunit HisH|nr:imidazole glycerol phosphate synthase subunit HisH [Bacillota bacterium]